MDALDALSTERLVLSTRRWPERRPVRVEATEDDVVRAEKFVSQLPILVRGSWSPALPLSPEDALLRMQAAVWELAARDHVLVGPAADAAFVLTDVLARGDGGIRAVRAAARLTSYLELRARFG